MKRTRPRDWISGVLVSQTTFLILALFILTERLFADRLPDTNRLFIFSLVIIGSFSLWGTAVGLCERLLFNLLSVDVRWKAGWMRTAAWSFSAVILLVIPLHPLMKSLSAQCGSFPEWRSYFTVCIATAAVAMIGLWRFASRCQKPLLFLFSTFFAGAVFFLTAGGTSLFSLLTYHFRSVQLVFFLIIWWGSLGLFALIYLIALLREKVAVRMKPTAAHPLLAIPSILCLICAGGLCWIDSHIYVGIYDSAHSFIRVLLYLLLEAGLLTLFLATGFLVRKPTAARLSCRFTTSIAIVTLVLCIPFSPSSVVENEMSLAGALVRPLSHLSAAVTGAGQSATGRATIPARKESKLPESFEPSPVDFTRPAAPHIFLIVLDALRADHLSCYGYARDTSPNIDSLARDGVTFRYCISPGCRTSEALPTLFSSREFLHLNMVGKPDWKMSLDSHPTIAEAMKLNGFFTLAAGTLFPAYYGYCKGFEEYIRCPDKDILPEIEGPLESAAGGRTYCYLHYFGVHGAAGLRPHLCNEPGFTRHSFGSDRTDNYDTSIKIIDRYVGGFLNYLKETGLYDKSIVIVTADHGAGLGEHGYFEHARGMYNGEVLVPLIIKSPGIAHKTVSETVGLIDLFPTILDFSGISGVKGLEGRSLLPLMIGDIERMEPDRTYFHTLPRHKGPRAAVIKGAFKLIDPDHRLRKLYAFKEDPLERENIINDLPRVAADLTQEFEIMAGIDLRPEPLPPVATPPHSLERGLIRRLFDNLDFQGKPVLENAESDTFDTRWDPPLDSPPERGYSIRWDGFILMTDTSATARVFEIKSLSNVEMWIDDVKCMNATGRCREFGPGYWRGYISLEKGLHSIRIQLSKRDGREEQLKLATINQSGKQTISPRDLFCYNTAEEP